MIIDTHLLEVVPAQLEAEPQGGRVQAPLVAVKRRLLHKVVRVHLKREQIIKDQISFPWSFSESTISLLMYHLSSAGGFELGDEQLTSNNCPTCRGYEICRISAFLKRQLYFLLTLYPLGLAPVINGLESGRSTTSISF